MFIYPTGHYVYAYIRNDGTPYYIGKGQGRRAFQPHKRRNGCDIKPNDNSRIVIIEQNLTNIGACAIERRLIRWHGTKDSGGILVNIREGGEGGSFKGRKHSKESIDKIKVARSKQIITQEHRRNIGLAHLGMKRSPETCRRISESNKGKTLTEEFKKKLSKAAKARSIHGNTGKKNEILTCPHCGKSGGASGMKRWHFDNCKSLILDQTCNMIPM